MWLEMHDWVLRLISHHKQNGIYTNFYLLQTGTLSSEFRHFCGTNFIYFHFFSYLNAIIIVVFHMLLLRLLSHTFTYAFVLVRAASHSYNRQTLKYSIFLFAFGAFKSLSSILCKWIISFIASCSVYALFSHFSKICVLYDLVHALRPPI